MLTTDEIKKLVAEHALSKVPDNAVVGLGSGTTAYYFTLALAEKVKQGFSVKGVPTSNVIKTLAMEQGIPVVELNDVTTIDITVDGADEIDPLLQLIKGGGGALLQEKMVAAASKELVIIADYSKLVKRLGKFPLPVEVIPYGWKQVQQVIEKQYAIKTSLRQQDQQPYVTDHGHYILDCSFKKIKDAASLAVELNQIPGVVEHGLFIDMADEVIVGNKDGSLKVLRRS